MASNHRDKDALYERASAIARELDESPNTAENKEYRFCSTLIDVYTARCPFDPYPGELILRERSPVSEVLKSRKAVALIGARGMGKTHLLLALQEFYHIGTKDEHQEEGLVAIINARDLQSCVGPNTSNDDSLKCFLKQMGIALLAALDDKSKRQGGAAKRGSGKQYRKSVNRYVFGLNRPHDASPEDLVQALSELVTGDVGGANSEIKSQLSDFVNSIESLSAGASPAQKLAMIISAFAENVQSIKTNPISAVFVCIDDISELRPKDRNLLTQFILNNFVNRPNQSIRFRFASYPTKTFASSLKSNPRYITHVQLDPHAELPPSEGDAIRARDRQFVTNYISPILKSRFRDLFESDGVSIFPDRNVRDGVLFPLYYGCGGQPRRLGRILMQAFDKAFDASSRDKKLSFEISGQHVKDTLIQSYQDFVDDSPGLCVLPEPITGLVDVFDPDTSPRYTQLLQELWASLADSDPKSALRCSGAFSSAFIIEKSMEYLLIPLVNTGHIMKRTEFRINPRGGATYVIYSLGYAFSLWRGLDWDVSMPKLTLPQLATVATASSAAFSMISEDLAKNIESDGWAV